MSNSADTETRQDAEGCALSAGDFIRHSPDHDDPRDAEVYLEHLEELQRKVFAGASDQWSEYFEAACIANEDCQVALTGCPDSRFASAETNESSRAIIEAAHAKARAKYEEQVAEYRDLVQGQDAWWDRSSYIDAQTDPCRD